jgi:phosphohistidine phosphatase
MHLYLVRHGEAKSGQEDSERPLNNCGREEVDRVSRAAAKKGMAASRIFHSDKLRAKETAEILRSFTYQGGTRGLRQIADRGGSPATS